MPFPLTTLLAPFHLLAYSMLLGTELYQSFIMTRIAHRALPRSAFTSLQKRVFPVYFRSQTLLLFLIAATCPPRGPLALLKRKPEGISLVIAGATAALNLFVFGPRTGKLMIERVHQATRDAKVVTEAGAVSDEMRRLKRSFSRAHAMCIHLNLITVGATLFYGWRLASKLRFEME